MGTNYYADVPPTAMEVLHGIRSDTVQVHLGKSSHGWVFLLRGHREWGVNDLRSMYRRILSRDNVVIYDEYGHVITLRHFINMVEIRSSGAKRSSEHRLSPLRAPDIVRFKNYDLSYEMFS